MNFHHLVEINDPLLPLIENLTRAQLWQGLLRRMTEPGLFVPYLDDCQITQQSPQRFSRTLRYDDVSIDDVVTLTPQQQIQVEVPAQKEIAASVLTVTIEEPQPDHLFVRFSYGDDSTPQANSAEAFYDSFRRSAYQEADIDTIKQIRQMAQDGKL